MEIIIYPFVQIWDQTDIIAGVLQAKQRISKNGAVSLSDILRRFEALVSDRWFGTGDLLKCSTEMESSELLLHRVGRKRPSVPKISNTTITGQLMHPQPPSREELGANARVTASNRSALMTTPTSVSAIAQP